MRLPNDAAAIPLPRLEQTPPETNMYFLMGLNYPVLGPGVSIAGAKCSNSFAFRRLSAIMLNYER